ncbi:MAG: SCO family protein [Bauldia sp.]
MTRVQKIRYAVWAAAAVVLLIAAVVFWTTSRETPRADAVTVGGPFTLVSETGEEVTEAALRGHPSLIFFGFTHCPDVCPTALGRASAWLDELGPAAEDLEVYFVTVDPARDTQEVIATYLTSFHPDIVGLTGPVDAVHAMLDSFFVTYEEVPLDGGGYLMNHTTSFYVLDDNAEFIGTIGTMEGNDEALATIRSAIAG